MAATGLIVLATTGGLGIAVAIVLGLALRRRPRRVDSPGAAFRDVEMEAALHEIQAEIDKGQRRF